MQTHYNFVQLQLRHEGHLCNNFPSHSREITRIYSTNKPNPHYAFRNAHLSSFESTLFPLALEI